MSGYHLDAALDPQELQQQQPQQQAARQQQRMQCHTRCV